MTLPAKHHCPQSQQALLLIDCLVKAAQLTSENSGLLAMVWRWQVASSLGSFWIYTDFIQWVSKVSFYYLTPLIHLCYRDPCPCSPWLTFSSTTVWVPLYWSLLDHLDPASRSTRVICCSFKGDFCSENGSFALFPASWVCARCSQLSFSKRIIGKK